MIRGNRPSPKLDDARGRKDLDATVPLKAVAAGKKDEYPVGIPVAPPPGRRGPVQPPPLPARPTPPPASRNEVRLASWDAPAVPPPVEDRLIRGAQIVMVVSLVIVCLGIGWFLSQGPKRKRPAAKETAQAAEQPRSAAASKEATRERQKAPAEAERGKPLRPTPTRPQAPPQPDPAPMGLTFQKDVLPIFQARCVNCHGRRKEAGLDVRTVAGLRAGGENGPAINGTSLESSLLWQSIETDSMPRGRKKLTPAEKKTIREWIAGGAR